MPLRRAFTALSTRACCTAALAVSAFADAAPTPDLLPSVRHPEWSRSAAIYEVNVRQFTGEGTLAAFDRELPRLRAIGVGIVWLMPVQPIGQQHRKGHLGSYYSIRDYRAVDPAYGTLADFRRVVSDAHALGMKVILDWVANHTAWDHPWISAHPDWYQHDAHGKLHYYVYVSGTSREAWTDVVGLDYRQPALWAAMIDTMKFWIRETDIDGFRCDVAGRVPVAFWNQARAELDAMKPVFMLAEADDPALHRAAFDMTYNWDLLALMRAIVAGKQPPAELARYLMHPEKVFPSDAYRMNFTSNHDINSWAGSDRELFGDGFEAFAVLAATWPGMPLIYGGQEAGFNKRLKFFERDPIDWATRGREGFYRKLLALKSEHPALWNGTAGGAPRVLATGNEAVFAFERWQGVDGIRVVFNFSARPQALDVEPIGALRLEPWGYKISFPSPASAPPGIAH
jgi:glycosidase